MVLSASLHEKDTAAHVGAHVGDESLRTFTG